MIVSILSALSLLASVLSEEEEFDSPYDAWKDDPYAIINALMRQENYERIGQILSCREFTDFILDYCNKEIEEFNKSFDWSKPHPIADFDFLSPFFWWSDEDSVRRKLIDEYRELHHPKYFTIYDESSECTIQVAAMCLYVRDADERIVTNIVAPGWTRYDELDCCLPKINCNEKVYVIRSRSLTIQWVACTIIKDKSGFKFEPSFYFNTSHNSSHYPKIIKTLQNNGFVYIPIVQRTVERMSEFLTGAELAFMLYVEPFFGKMSDKDIYNNMPKKVRDFIGLEHVTRWRKNCFVKAVK